ncbi:MAG TPA: FtsX-like permease family protein, partial [Jatrophihabitantaceae bacterium]
MIGLALRLTVAGGREAVTRLTLIVVAVAIGVGLLLATVAGLNAVHSQNDRYAWLETGFAGGATSAGPAGDPIWWRLRADRFDGNDIGQVDLAATGANPPLPPGMTALPGPGEYYASPAMAALLRRIPAAELADRYPGRLIGTIGSAALPSPDTLVIVIGHTAAELSHQSDAELVNRISTTAPDQCAGAGCAVGVGTNANGITLILAVVAAALLFPVLLFIGNATRLSAARREQRLAAMRLVGATPRQTAVVSTVESSLAAAVGTAFGFAMFFAARPAIAGIPFTGARFFVGDLSLNLIDVLAVGLGIPVAAALAARLALRRVTISPLGVT